MTSFNDQGNENSIQSLKQALDNLEIFTQQIEKKFVANFSHLEVQKGKVVATESSSLKKTIILAYNTLLSSKSKNQSTDVLEEILHSSDIIKSYFPLIQVMEEGTVEQKSFAFYAKNAIKRFNDAIDEVESQPPSWKKKIARLLYQKSGLLIGERLVKIELPQKAFLHIDFPKVSSDVESKKIPTTAVCPMDLDEASLKISTLREMVIPTFQVQRQTLELFHMKMIALLEKNKLMSNREARTIVLKTPTQLEIDKQAQMLTISQQLIPLPGQCISVSATFQMDPRTLNYNIFYSDSLSAESMQTGFPHPSQHNGWGLSPLLIPRCLHRPNQVRYFPRIFNDQLKLAQDLLPNGPLNEKAKLFLRLKQQAFEAHRREFLDYHKLLAFSIANAAPQEIVPPNFIEETNAFFQELANHATPYNFLSQTYEELVTGWIAASYQALDSAWLNGKLTTVAEATVFLDQQKEIKIDSWFKKIQAAQEAQNEPKQHALLYTLSIGKFIEPSIQRLILQQQSELMQCPPPELDLFTKKFQTALYLQLWEFQHELLLEPNETDFFRRLSRLLEDDITLFKAHDLKNLHWDAVAITLELEAYYKERAASWPGIETGA